VEAALGRVVKKALAFSIFLAVFVLFPVKNVFSQSPDELPVGFRYSHKISINPVTGLPGLIAIRTIKSSTLAQIRALLILDSRLVVLPLSYYQSTRIFGGEFPTPAESLKYQLQFTFTNGKSVLSDTYVVNPKCKTLGANEDLVDAIAFDAQRKLIEEADTYEKTSALLEHITKRISVISGREE